MRALAILLLSCAASAAVARDVVINELLYHPRDDGERLEFIELHNRGATAADLSGWRFDRGVSYVFPGGTAIAAGGFLVVCRDVGRFRAAYGADVPIAGAFEGTLVNGGERVTLVDAAGMVADSVRYEDRAPWPVAADGGGSSLERICAAAGGEAWNWAPSPLPADSGEAGGTPGRANESASATPTPLVVEAHRQPETPRPDEPVAVAVRVASFAPVRAVTLEYRVCGAREPGAPVAVPMRSEPSDASLYRATIPGVADMRLVRYTVRVEDEADAVRVEPSPHELRPAFSYIAVTPTGPTTVPVDHLILVDRVAEPQQGRRPPRRGRGFFDLGGLLGRRDSRVVEPSPRGPWAFVRIAPDGRSVTLRDYVQAPPRSGGYKVRFHKDARLDVQSPGESTPRALATINLIDEGSQRFLLAERLAYELFRRAGVPAPLAEHVRLSVNGRAEGFHLLVEQPNRAFLRRNGRDDRGNLYKILWYESGVVGQHEKKTNRDEGHEDVVALVDALNGAEGDEQWRLIESSFNVDEVASYFAVNMCLSNWDGFFNNYFTYHDTRGTGKWEIYPWDEDKTWGYYDGSRDIFYDMPLDFGSNLVEGARSGGGFGFGGGFPGGRRGGRGGRGGWWRPPGWFSGPLLANATFRKRFLERLDDIVRTISTEEVFEPLFAGLEARLVPEVRRTARERGGSEEFAETRLRADVDSLREHLRLRRAFVLEQEELAALRKARAAEASAGDR